MRSTSLLRRSVSEALGSAFLLMAVAGSGIMGERLAGGNVGLALLANSIATGAALAALILALGPISGAHFNPVVTLGDALNADRPWSDVPSYVTAQLLGAAFGVCLANAMFGKALIAWSRNSRDGWHLLLGEFVATFGLITIIRGCARRESSCVAYAVATYISAAYWFTSSTSFANPAVTLARSLTDSFAGIRPVDVPGFVVAQCGGAVAALLFFRWLVPGRVESVSNVKRKETAMDRVIFACRHNAGRSQMAAAFFNRLADPERAQAISAGTTPADRVHPEVAVAMKEIGLDVSKATPQLLTTEFAARARLLVTMGCGEECPHMPGLQLEDWPLEDPKGQPLERVRQIRDEVESRVAELVKRRGWERAPRG